MLQHTVFVYGMSNLLLPTVDNNEYSLLSIRVYTESKGHIMPEDWSKEPIASFIVVEFLDIKFPYRGR